ncbi:acetyl/propionyl/methylcrotonyl-CoA carboxylase subunit alpha [Candidatus Chloroploca sp. Khr17]|uniref:acetyl-CoA carboxylase biotin carboxylase subunit n=1 Tax=Candidatus Chloroploca sp. Khr17 TaxID=2496869 RepID=UPI00101D4E62|nr:biotin carboxylase N-terminal domain-containing protein [Candidatus Chloroploca sp. Khr17]
MFKRVLIANRGEIAVRMVRACRDLGIAAIAVYEPGDEGALHVRLADEAYPIMAQLGYRDPDAMLAAARTSKVDAVLPGYGLISEHPGFAQACEAAGIAVVGPGSTVLSRVRDKVGAIAHARAVGIPTTQPSSRIFMPDEAQALLSEADSVGYPLVVKACAGGRGRGTFVARGPDDLLGVVRRSSAAAQSVYLDAQVYLEKAVLPSRYIEVPILGDHHGNLIHLGERDGSIQRNTRKVIEETPAPNLSQAQREAIWATAIQVARLFSCRSACTIEFVLDDEGNHFFTEVKPRLQVEHPVNEMVTRIDVVREQLRIAAGLPLGFAQEEVHLQGHAIFCRINAEDPWRGYLPSPGHITGFRIPGGPNVRVDTYAYAGAEIPVRYDSLLAKLVVWGPTREECIRRVHRALQEFQITGVQTNLALLWLILNDDAFIAGTYTTEFSRRRLLEMPPVSDYTTDLAAIVALAYLQRTQAAHRAIPEAFTSGWHRDSRRLPQ